MQQAEEPSVEEILESIKKVIARDNREGAAEQRRQREKAGTKAEFVDPDEILDLGLEAEMLEDEAEESDADGADKDEQAAPILSENAQSSMRESLAALAMLSKPSARPQIVRSGETSLEGLAREMLRPMLSEWLSANLPDLVERLVAVEIARIAGKKG